MKIKLVGEKDNPTVIDASNNSLIVPHLSTLYFNFAREYTGLKRRHSGELVMRNGWVCLDYDEDGYLIGLEVHEGDPLSAGATPIGYLQPDNVTVQ